MQAMDFSARACTKMCGMALESSGTWQGVSFWLKNS